jgi:hypothetical protein
MVFVTILLGFLLIVAVVTFIFAFIEPYRKTLYLIISGAFLLPYLIILFLKPYYFIFDIEKDKIVVKFYHAHPFISNYSQIKFPLQQFDGYDIRGWLVPKLILKINTGKQKGKYPPVSISFLSKKEKQKLKEILDNIQNNKNFN